MKERAHSLQHWAGFHWFNEGVLLFANTVHCCVFLLLQAVSDAMLVELKQCFMEAYDDNQDGKIDIREVISCS